jgi:hypothetical protein
MNRAALKDLVYGGIEEMSQNSRLYYNSSIGSNYNHWTDLGKENVVEFLNMVAGEMYKCRQIEDEQRSRDMVLKELKS